MMSETLLGWLSQSVKRYPESEAVVYKDQRVSYEELWQSVCSVGCFLQKKNIGKGDRVAILAENSPQYIATYYGILSVGGVVVPLNTASKAKDLTNWIEHSGSKWVFVDREHPELTRIGNGSDGSPRVFLLDLEGAATQAEQNVAQWSDLDSTDVAAFTPVEMSYTELASIIYTSGTTADPKGVMLSHGNLVHNVRSVLDYLHLTSSARILNVLPFFYSYGNSVLHTHLAVGGTLVLENSLVYPHKLMREFEKESITGFSGVPATFALLLSRVRFSEYDLSSLKYMTVAGGKMIPAHIQRITEEVPNAEFVVMYGQTEATARISYLPSEKLQGRESSAGIAIPGVVVEVRDERGRSLPNGQVGEIWVKGKNIMRGYWRNPEATEEAIANGWLKTGDMAYMDDDGYIFIQGRNSEMIKAGANRIHPMEIEEVIGEIDGVRDVAVVGMPDELLGEVIKAVVVSHSDVNLNARDIQAYCRKNLAQYKIPKLIEFSTDLPRTTSGKIKRYMLSK